MNGPRAGVDRSVVAERQRLASLGERPSWPQRALDRAVSPALSRLLWRTQLAQDEFPGIIGLEVTSICNLKCPMCPRTFSARKFGHMPLAAITRLLDEIAPFDARGLVEQVALQEYGEIFLHPDWFGIIEHACERITPSHLRLDTNGTLMRPEVIDRLFESRLPSLIISVDGVDEESYDLLRKGGRFPQVMANLGYFVERRRERPDRGPTAYIQIIESDYTRPFLLQFKERWETSIGTAERIHVRVIKYHDFGGQIDDARFDRRRTQGLYVSLPCYRLTYELDVFSDGIASVCCMDAERQIAIGNIHERSLAEIWRGPEARQYREEMRRARYQRLPLCHTCPHSQKFLANYVNAGSVSRVSSYLRTAGRRLMKRRMFGS